MTFASLFLGIVYVFVSPCALFLSAFVVVCFLHRDFTETASVSVSLIS